MRWDALFEDLEAQLAAADRLAMESDTSERTRMELAGRDFCTHLDGQRGRRITVRVGAGLRFTGTLERLGDGWLSLSTETGTAVVPVPAILMVEAQPDSGGARAEQTGGPTARLRPSLASALRALARDRAAATVYLRDGGEAVSLHGTIDRVGRDYFELAAVPQGEIRRRDNIAAVLWVPTAALVAVVSD